MAVAMKALRGFYFQKHILMKSKITTHIAAQMKEDRKAGFTLQQIAEKHGVSRTTVGNLKDADFDVQLYKEYIIFQKYGKIQAKAKPKPKQATVNGCYDKLLKKVRERNYKSVADYISKNGLRKFKQEIKL